jgi:hypothetical protein
VLIRQPLAAERLGQPKQPPFAQPLQEPRVVISRGAGSAAGQDPSDHSTEG